MIVSNAQSDYLKRLKRRVKSPYLVELAHLRGQMSSKQCRWVSEVNCSIMHTVEALKVMMTRLP